ncbi:YceD family protein [Escherichia coli]
MNSNIVCDFLSFDIDHQRLAVIKGHSDVDVTLECQRCGGHYPFTHRFTQHIVLALLFSDERAEALPEEYEPVDVDEFGEINLLAMIEDEIILNLPVVPGT